MDRRSVQPGTDRDAGQDLLANEDTRSVIITAETFAEASADSSPADDEEALPDKVACCSPGWPALWTIVVLDTTAGIILGLMLPDLATEWFNDGVDPCKGNGAGTAACNAAIEKVSRVSTIFGTASSIISFVMNPLVGVAADTWGRRPLLVISILSTKLSILTVLSVVLCNVPIYFFYASNEISALFPQGIIGQLWVMDRTPPHERAKVYGRLSAAGMIEGIVVPLFAVFLTRTTSCFALLFLSVIAAFVAIFGLQESLPKAKRTNRDTSSHRAQFVNGFRGIKNMLANPSYRTVALVGFLGTCVTTGCTSIYFMFLKNRFGAEMKDLAPINALNTFTLFFVMTFVIKPLENLLGLKWLTVASFCVGMCQCSAYAFAGSYLPLWSLYPISFIGGFSSMCGPCMTAWLTNKVSHDVAAQGADAGIGLGGFASLFSISGIVAPLMFRAVFLVGLEGDLGIQTANGPWFLGIAMDIFCIALLVATPRSEFPDTPAPPEPSQVETAAA